MWDKVFYRNEDVVARKIMEETILVPIKSNQADMQRLFTLNSVGEFIWEKLDGTSNLGDICGALMSSYEVERKTAESDTLEFITDLLHHHLIGCKS